MGYKVEHVPQEVWRHHMILNHAGNKETEKDKPRAKESHKDNNNEFAAFCMDLESVLLAPSLEANAIFFKTKLAVHNFTVYCLGQCCIME